ncbi:ScyD/ScyE family protein [Pseudarthrobacter sp. NamE2]|uniref:ScyD/ScyE family protein n=1 Tax=Pseudarthrobacter sp. NamE2 TaxID=2576838 RepID=UPI0010FCFDDB|nr:ScyD/ScyE family protein [Pseudarthrobacter sp. NamE2]TLM84930.1 ScyD/ScyE family protein [Pseudarthrobacter sp. NamE2]
MKKHLTFIACIAVTSMVQAAPAIAATDEPDYEVMATGLLSPLHLAVDKDESVLVSQAFAGILTHVEDDGDLDDVYTTPNEGWSVAGVDIHDSTAYFLESFGAGQGPDGLRGYLKALDSDGEARTIADLADYERKFNPDAGQHYGFEADTGQQCLAEAASRPDAPPAQYTGTLDSNPYAVAVREDTAYVADAGMNAVLKVDLESGSISTVAVLPPRPLTITHKIAQSLGVPSCAGFTYGFEPVPTDVEIGPDGWLYVSSLPGGPEDPSLGPRGAIFKVNPWTGATVLWQNAIVSPTGLAVSDEGDVYVASLFGGEILKFTYQGERSHFLKVNLPAAVEFRDGDVFATIDALPPQPDPATPDAPMPKPEGKLIEVDFD